MKKPPEKLSKKERALRADDVEAARDVLAWLDCRRVCGIDALTVLSYSRAVRVHTSHTADRRNCAEVKVVRAGLPQLTLQGFSRRSASGAIKALYRKVWAEAERRSRE